MKRFKGFVIKEFYHIFRDYRTMVILFGMPFVQILLFGFAITNEINNAGIAILDNSKDAVTRKITDKILSSAYFKLEKNLDNYSQIEENFRNGKIKEVIVFENNFAQKLEKEKKASIQIIADASDPNTANILSNYTISIINNYQQELIQNQKLPMQIDTEVKMLYNEELKGVFMFVPGTITILLMLISAMMTSISITREKELGTMEILLASPLKPIQIIIGKVVPYIFISFMIAVIILVMGFTVFGMPVQGSLLLLMGECLLFIIMALSLGIFISTVTDTQQTAMMISMFGLMLPTILLSGFIFPIENMPLPLQLISNIVPPRWFIIIIKAIMLKGVGITYIWKETLIIVFMTFVFIMLSIKKFKVRLK
ncbi:MAG: ABC transporter permease [Bacteroidales bacterium]